MFGRVAGFSAVVEPQVDGRLHLHAIVYGAAVTPALLTRAASCPALWPHVEQWIEAVCSTGVFAEARPWCDAWREAHDGKTSRAFNVVVPDASVDYSGFLLASEKMACSTNVHTHSQTCRKGVRGRYACRLSRPAGVHGKATQHLLVRLKASSHLGKRKRAEFVVESASCVAAAIDLRQSDEKRLFREYTNGAVVWEQRRPASDALFVETNLALVCLSRSHTNAALISGLDSGVWWRSISILI